MFNFFAGVFFGFIVCFILVWVLRELSFGVFADNGLDESIETIQVMQNMGFGVEIYFNPAKQWKAQGKLYVKVYGLHDKVYGSVSKRGFWHDDLATAVKIAYGEALGLNMAGLGLQQPRRENNEINTQ